MEFVCGVLEVWSILDIEERTVDLQEVWSCFYPLGDEGYYATATVFIGINLLCNFVVT